jgi:hypothetical protein
MCSEGYASSDNDGNVGTRGDCGYFYGQCSALTAAEAAARIKSAS